jgi:hypothetical protein
MDHSNGNFGKSFGNSFKAAKQKVRGDHQRFDRSSHFVFEFFVESVGLVVVAPKPPESIFATGKYFRIATGLPNRYRSDGMPRIVVLVVVVAVVVSIITIVIF